MSILRVYLNTPLLFQYEINLSVATIRTTSSKHLSLDLILLCGLCCHRLKPFIAELSSSSLKNLMLSMNRMSAPSSSKHRPRSSSNAMVNQQQFDFG